MNNIEHLRSIIKHYASTGIDTTEAEEFIDAVEDEYNDKVAGLEAENDTLQTELDDLKDQEDQEDQEETISVFLGLDTLHYRLEQGNLRIQQQLEAWINNIKKQNCAGVEMPS